MSYGLQTNPLAASRMGRRMLLRGSLLGSAGLAAAALVGCGSDDEEPGPTGTAAATATGAATGPGKLVQDPALPYPYNFPEPATQPKPGGVMQVAATWDVADIDPTVSAAGGTVTVP